MIKKINKKFFFGFSLITSSIIAMLFSISKKTEVNILSLITETPLGSIERVSANDGGGGDCSGSFDGAWAITPPSGVSVSGVGIQINKYTAPAAEAAAAGASSFGGRSSGCFISGTEVLLGDNSIKAIEKVTLDDTLMTSEGPQKVMKTYTIPYRGLVYAFNGDANYFVTPTHPFMTNNGWKSLDPTGTKRESPGLDVELLTVGDTLILRNNVLKKLEKLDSKEVETTVYNFGVNGTHDFFADDYLVHNVDTDTIIKTGELALKQIEP